MFVKKFEAESVEAALAKVKEELGPDALILETKKEKRGFLQKSGVSVTAAYASPGIPAAAKKTLADIFPHRQQSTSQGPVERPATPSVLAPKVRVAAVQKYAEVAGESSAKKDSLRVSTRTGASKGDDRFSRFEALFLKCGLSEESARELTRRMLFDFSKEDLAVPSFREKALGSLLGGAIRELSESAFLDSGSWVAIGPAGAGKTSVLVKIALALKAKGHSSSLVALDKRKILGVNELAAYAKLIQVPFEAEMREYSDHSRVQLIDGPCLPFTDEKMAARSAESLKGKSVILVLDGTRRLEEMLKSFEDAQAFYPRAVCFTRWEEAIKLGAVYDFLRRSRLPLLGISKSRSFKIPFTYLKKSELVQQMFSQRSEAARA